MSLSLKDALTTAIQYTKAKPQEGQHYEIVLLRDGLIRATNGLAGCEIPCEAVKGLTVAVNASKMLSMVKAVGDAVKLKAAKGRAIEIIGPGVKFKLKAIPKDAEPTFPGIPKAGWKKVTGEQVTVIDALGSVVDPKAANVGFQDALAFAWIEGLVKESVSIEPNVFSGLTDDCDMCVTGGNSSRTFVRSRETNEVRWSINLVAEWPDAHCMQLLGNVREAPHRQAKLDIGELKLLAQQACVVGVDRAEAFRLTVDADTLALQGAQGAMGFRGSVDVREVAGAEQEAMGVRPDRLVTFCGAIKSAASEATLAAAGAFTALRIWGGEDVVIEALVMPVRLD